MRQVRATGPDVTRKPGDDMGTQYVLHTYNRDYFSVECTPHGFPMRIVHREDDALHPHTLALFLTPEHRARILTVLLGDMLAVEVLDDDGRAALRAAWHGALGNPDCECGHTLSAHDDEPGETHRCLVWSSDPDGSNYVLCGCSGFRRVTAHGTGARTPAPQSETPHGFPMPGRSEQ